MKKTVSTYSYCLPLRWNTPSQNFWTLFTTATMRQSCRSFASCAGSAVLARSSAGVSPRPTLLVVERRKLPETAAAGEERDQQ